MSSHKENSRILARTFFNQLRAAGYTPTQIIGVATELLDLVTVDIKEADRAAQSAASAEAAVEWRQEA